MSASDPKQTYQDVCYSVACGTKQTSLIHVL
jgi:hypothetical protein